MMTSFSYLIGGLNPEQEYKVISSYESPTDFQGDYLRYYCIQASQFNPKRPDEWVWGNQESKLFQQARDLNANTGNIEQCFGAGILGNDQSVAADFVQFQGTREFITGAEMIFYHKNTNRILYVGLKT